MRTSDRTQKGFHHLTPKSSGVWDFYGFFVGENEEICILPTQNNGLRSSDPRKQKMRRNWRVSLRRRHGLEKAGFALLWTSVGAWPIVRNGKAARREIFCLRISRGHPGRYPGGRLGPNFFPIAQSARKWSFFFARTSTTRRYRRPWPDGVSENSMQENFGLFFVPYIVFLWHIDSRDTTTRQEICFDIKEDSW